MFALMAAAHADAIFQSGQNISNFVSVVGTSGETGMTINGATNKTPSVPIRFTSPQSMVGGSGAASIDAPTGTFLSSVTISAPGFSFDSIEFNATTLSCSGVLMISVLMTNGQTFTCPLSTCAFSNVNGNNRYTVFTANGERILDVTISSIGGSGTGFKELSQVRFNGSAGGFEPIPEPGTLGLLGTGLISLAGITRRKLKLGVLGRS